MLPRRLTRLAALTQGLALIGVGACNDSPPHEPPTMNAPYNPSTDAAPPAVPTASEAGMAPPTINSPPMTADAGDEFKPPHTINAPPRNFKPQPAPKP